MNQIKFILQVALGVMVLFVMPAGASEFSDQLMAPKVSADFINKFTVGIKDLNDQRDVRRVLSSWKPLARHLIYDGLNSFYVFQDNLALLTVTMVSPQPMILQVNDLPPFKISGGIVSSYKKWRKELTPKHASTLESIFGRLLPEATAEEEFQVNEKLLVLFASRQQLMFGPGAYFEGRAKGKVFTASDFLTTLISNMPEIKCDADPIEGQGELSDYLGSEDWKAVPVHFSVSNDARVVLTTGKGSFLVEIAKVPTDGVNNPVFRRLGQCSYKPDFKKLEYFREFYSEYKKSAPTSKILKDALDERRDAKLAEATDDLNHHFHFFNSRCEDLVKFETFTRLRQKLASVNCAVDIPVKDWDERETESNRKRDWEELARKVVEINPDEVKEKLQKLEGACRDLSARFAGSVHGDGEMKIFNCEDAKCEKVKGDPLSNEQIQGNFFGNAVPAAQDSKRLRQSRPDSVRILALNAISAKHCCGNLKCIEYFNANNRHAVMKPGTSQSTPAAK